MARWRARLQNTEVDLSGLFINKIVEGDPDGFESVCVSGGGVLCTRSAWAR
jgi:hypothetical protein